MDQLENKVALVTGAASGIGRSMAGAFAAEGMKLFLADLDAGALEVAAAELRAAGSTVTTMGCDVADGAQIESLAERVLAAYDAVHVVCNNAGVAGGGMVAGFDVEAWKKVIDIDLWSVLHGLRVFLPILAEQGEGHIVNTASVAGLFSGPFMGPYSVAKFGVVAISEAAFLEQAAMGTGVGISVLCPGWVRTGIADNMPSVEGADDGVETLLREAVKGFIDQGMDPEQVAAMVVDAVKRRRFYILTHEDSVAVVRRRMEAILTGSDPAPIAMESI